MRKLSFIALLVLTSELALAQITLSVPDVNAAPGSNVIVPVSISDGEGITAIQFALTFNTTHLSIPAEGSVLGGSALTDHSVGSNLEDGKLTIVIFSGSSGKWGGAASQRQAVETAALCKPWKNN